MTFKSYEAELEQRIRELERETRARRRAEEALREQLHFLQTLIDTIPSPIFYKNAQCLYRGCNKTFAARLGLSKEDILGKSAHELFPRDLADSYHETDMALLDDPGEQVQETTLIYADGTVHDVVINKATWSNVDGALGGLVGVLTDITERKRAEGALRKAHDELEIRVRKRTEELARTNEDLRSEVAERKRVEDALRESSEKLKLFSYSITHDLKSPTIGIHGLTRLLHKQYREILDDKGRLYCDQILKASEQVVALVEKINAFITTRETPILIEPVNLRDVLQMIRSELAGPLTLRGIDLSESESLPEIRADRLSILRLFRNLIDNALKYGGAALSRITIGYEGSDAAHHILSVSDDGVGVRQEDREKIFHLFERNGKSHSVEGSGLGLAIVREIATRHGGSAWVGPGDPRGARFFVSIARDL